MCNTGYLTLTAGVSGTLLMRGGQCSNTGNLYIIPESVNFNAGESRNINFEICYENEEYVMSDSCAVDFVFVDSSGIQHASYGPVEISMQI